MLIFIIVLKNNTHSLQLVGPSAFDKKYLAIMILKENNNKVDFIKFMSKLIKFREKDHILQLMNYTNIDIYAKLLLPKESIVEKIDSSFSFLISKKEDLLNIINISEFNFEIKIKPAIYNLSNNITEELFIFWFTGCKHQPLWELCWTSKESCEKDIYFKNFDNDIKSRFAKKLGRKSINSKIELYEDFIRDIIMPKKC